MWLGLTLSTRLRKKSRPQTHTRGRESAEEFSDALQSKEGKEVIWLPPRDSNPDMLIQRHAVNDFQVFRCFY